MICDSLKSLGIIPIRDSTENPLALKDINAGENLLTITIDQLRSSRHISKIVVSTNNILIMNFLSTPEYMMSIHKEIVMIYIYLKK